MHWVSATDTYLSGWGESEDINGGSLEVDCGGVPQECICTACGAFWKDHYALTGFSMIEEGRKHG